MRSPSLLEQVLNDSRQEAKLAKFSEILSLSPGDLGGLARVNLRVFKAWLYCVLLLWSSNSLAAPPHVELFHAGTWQQLQSSLPRPAAVVFTATYCASCPAVLEKLRDTLRERQLTQTVVAVLIDDVEDDASLSSHHFAAASRLFVFAGDEAKLRYGVDPRWRAITPYVALLGKNKVEFVAGMPNDAQVADWLTN